MIGSIDQMPSKDAKNLPDAAKEIFLATYNEDFGWRCSEAHALKAAWRAVDAHFQHGEDGTWVPR
ncbi:MAG: ChaB family protein [Thermoplasmatota archaeon]